LWFAGIFLSFLEAYQLKLYLIAMTEAVIKEKILLQRLKSLCFLLAQTLPAQHIDF